MPAPSKPRTGRPCPLCHAPMVLKKHRSVELDICEQHGVWLDVGELEAIVGRVKRFEGARRRTETRKARSSGKVSGWLFGPLAFLFD